jgi:hypothetical protein
MNCTSWLSIGAAALLAGCGGGHGDSAGNDAATSAEVPASASASPRAFSAYVGSLPADDRAPPLAIDKVVPPTSETSEPIDVS